VPSGLKQEHRGEEARERGREKKETARETQKETEGASHIERKTEIQR
jgi:hypothetical protein